MNKIVLFLFLGSLHLCAQSSDDLQFNALMRSLSNSGRWGAADERGTLNFVDSETVLNALLLPKKGKTVSLSRVLDTVKTAVNRNPFEHRFSKGDTWKGDVFNSDYFGVDYHGASHSHLDGLTHITHNDSLYNGFPIATVTTKGATRLGVDTYKDGIVSRAVLIDLPLLYGRDYLPSGTPVMAADLLAFERKFQLRIQKGDILLIRTGRWQEVEQKGLWQPFERATGLHYTSMQLLYDRQVAVLGSDGINDVFPSGIPSEPAPIHKLALVAMGMPLLDNLDLDALSKVAQQEQQWHFLITLHPLYVLGASGSPINPIVVY